MASELGWEGQKSLFDGGLFYAQIPCSRCPGLFYFARGAFIYANVAKLWFLSVLQYFTHFKIPLSTGTYQP